MMLFSSLFVVVVVDVVVVFFRSKFPQQYIHSSEFRSYALTDRDQAIGDSATVLKTYVGNSLLR